jgi:hypothetical protein
MADWITAPEIIAAAVISYMLAHGARAWRRPY